MQESRLFRILYYLLDKGHATAPELAEKFEVSVRTIYRDVDAISSAGIPIYVTTGRNGGIQFLDDYVLNKSFFSDSEKLEILSSLQSLSAVQYILTSWFTKIRHGIYMPFVYQEMKIDCFVFQE